MIPQQLGRVLLAVALAACGAAQAQEFPQGGRAIRILNPFPAGGSSDLFARSVASRMQQGLGVPVVVENKPGGSTVVAVRELMKSPPDGHTILYTITITTSQLPHLYAKPPYDIFKDFTPLGLAAYNRTILMAGPNTPFNSVKELIAYAKANPGKVNYASFGNGSTAHINSELLKQVAGIDMLHVPYKGGADAGRDLMGGQVQIFFDGPATAINGYRSGKLKMLAIADGKRVAAVPEIPTMGEAGVAGFDLSGIEQFLGPAGMPRAIVERLNAEIVKAIRTPEVTEIYERGGSDVVASSADEHARIMKDNYERWGAVIRRVGVRLD
jgi:tripartite-type tricarboxylate transporter receptor subunit TctC